MERILVIDDDDACLDGLTMLLNLDGYQAVGAHSATEALERLRREDFGAVVTDMEMPDLDGVGVVHAAHAIRPALPVILLTANAPRGPLRRAALDAGAQSVLGKPIDYDHLLTVLAGCISRPH